MEDIIRMLVDVVRTQHSATEGTDEKPFDMDDVVDMAMNLIGRPEGDEAVNDLTNKISDMVSSFAPDIFPPKTFEQMDDTERFSSAASMIEASLMRGSKKKSEPAKAEPYIPPKNDNVSMNPDDYAYGNDSGEDYSGGASGFNPQQAADLNDAIYNNFMQMMGLSEPKLEYPFDRSQIRYGKEKSFTEQLAEEEEEKRKEAQQTRALSAWELAQDAIDKDDAAHEKETYVPKMEEPKGKSASQLAAEAIKQAEERDKLQRQVEQQAAHMMEVAQKQGKDPMQFVMHQQEILAFMESQSDELVSFEDYEDLAPEEKLEIERAFHIKKQLDDGVDPDKIDREVPPEYIPYEFEERRQEQIRKAEEIAALTGNSPLVGSAPSGTTEVSTAQAPETPAFTEEMLRALSQEVLRENSDMILADNADANFDDLNNMIFENIRNMMAGSGVAVEQENVDDLMEQVIASNRAAQLGGAAPAVATSGAPSASVGMGGGGSSTQANVSQPATQEASTTGMSAVEIAMAAQRAAQPEPKVVRQTKSAAEIAREAQERASQARARLFEEEDESITGKKFVLEKDEQPGPVFKREMPLSEEKEEVIIPKKTSREDIDAANVDPSEKKEKKSQDPRDKEIEEMERKLKEQESKKVQVDAVAASDSEAIAALKASLAAQKIQEEEDLDLSDLSMDDMDFDDDLFAEDDEEDMDAEQIEASSVTDGTEDAEEASAEDSESEVDDLMLDEEEEASTAEGDSSEEDETEEDIEYIDPDAKVLGDHTQAEIDEALDNLSTLGLEGDVYDRAKRMLLLELAGSEEELDAWLLEQENKKQRAMQVDLQDEEVEDLADIDEDELEDELESALDEEFGVEEDASDDSDSDPEEDQDSDNEDVKEDATASDDENADEEDSDVEEDDEIVVEDTTSDTMEDVSVEEQEEADVVTSEAESSSSTHSYDKKSDSKKRVKRAQKGPQKAEGSWHGSHGSSTQYGVSVRQPFSFKNSASFMDKFEEYIADTQENRKLSTGFKKLDTLLRYGLHKGSYFIDSEPQHLKNGFMQQLADRAAETGVDVLYISTELSRYDLMLDTVSRLSYEMNGKNPEKAVSVIDIMTGEDGADLASLKDELNWYRGRISEHLFLLDQEAVEDFVDTMDEDNPAKILEEMIRSIVREGSHKPVIFIDNIENIIMDSSYQAMGAFMEGIKMLAKELGIPILMSYGYAQAESEAELYPEEKEFHAFLGNLCDVYLELKYADMIAEDSTELTAEDIRDMMEDGETLLMDVIVHRNRRPMKASCQIQGTPKFNFYEE